jgi:hypothetical protein
VESREARLGKNEALFREVNERIREITTYDSDVEFLCECSDENCTDSVRMTLGEYEGLRADPTHFAVVPGHEVEDIETVIISNDRFAVVEKRAGEATKVALETDPRA